MAGGHAFLCFRAFCAAAFSVQIAGFFPARDLNIFSYSVLYPAPASCMIISEFFFPANIRIAN